MKSCKELVVVLLLLLMLSAFGVLALTRGSEAWKNEICSKNLSEIYRMARTYADANDGMIAPIVRRTSPKWTFWYSYIIRYTDNPAFFYCPANGKAAKFFTEERDPLEPISFDEVSQSYGMNYHLCPEKDGLRMDNVANPSYVIYFGDSMMPYLRATEHCWKDDYAPRHEGKSNFIFMDGHVEQMNHENLGLCQSFGDWKKDIDRWKPKLK